MDYKIKKGMMGYRVHYNCPGCKTGLHNPINEAGITDVCPDCGTSYEVPGKQRWNEMKAAEDRKQKEREEQAKEKAKKKAEAKLALIESRQLSVRPRTSVGNVPALTSTDVNPEPSRQVHKGTLIGNEHFPQTEAHPSHAVGTPVSQQPVTIVNQQPAYYPPPQQQQPVVVNNIGHGDTSFLTGCLQVMLIIILAPFVIMIVLAVLGAMIR